jgi:hypothetical protein
MNAYQILCEVISGPHPNIDLLIIKPALFVYVHKNKIEEAKNIGIRADKDNLIHAYFTRIPESLPAYDEFLSNNIPVRITYSKLKKVKDQKLKIYPVNLPNYKGTLSDDDIEKIMNKADYFYSFFKSGKDISQIPHAAIWVENGVLPSFTYKLLDNS